MSIRTRQTAAQWDVPMVPTPAWRFIGMHVTCVPDVEYPWPEAMVRRIREEFDPGFVPIFRRMLFITPAGSVHVFRHHGVARYDKHAEPNPIVAACPMPSSGYGARFEHPNVVDRWFEAKVIPGTPRHRQKLPPAFVPWGDWVERWARETYLEATAAEKQALNDEQAAESARLRQAEEDEAAYRVKHDAAYQRRLYDSLGADDVKEAEARQSGQVQPERKPFVEVHSGATQ